jgi:hypothetical protein
MKYPAKLLQTGKHSGFSPFASLANCAPVHVEQLAKACLDALEASEQPENPRFIDNQDILDCKVQL